MRADPLRRLAWLRAWQENLSAGALAAALAAADRAAAAAQGARLAQRDPARLACSAAILRLGAFAGARLRARTALAEEASARARREVGTAAEVHRRARQERALVERALLRWEVDRRRKLARVAEAGQDDRRWR